LLTEPQTVAYGNFEFRGNPCEYYTSIDLDRVVGNAYRIFAGKTEIYIYIYISVFPAKFPLATVYIYIPRQKCCIKLDDAIKVDIQDIVCEVI